VVDDEGEPSDTAQPLRTATSAGSTAASVEGALADGVRAIVEAMRRAPADALPGLAERMTVLVGELKARREVKAEVRTGGDVVAFEDQRRRRR
jgi:hypothetical protein